MLAAAVLELYPGTKLGIGPTIENGFYFDFQFPDGVVVNDSDLPKIQKTMKKWISRNLDFVGREVTVDQARAEEADQPFKLELIDEFAADGETLTIYESGDYKDLCRGGHSSNTSEIPVDGLKLDKVAGAYWRGDEKNPMLTRIYGFLFESREALDAHLQMIEEAKKRDHRKLGVDLDLFTFSELVGPGLPLWTPRGGMIRNILDDYVWELRRERGFQKVEIPHITKKELYEASGHWSKFSDELFKVHTREGHEFVMKPMNCPHHTQIFDRKPHSYREMPQRYANTTMVYRDEQTGELNGLSRVRSITQDDAHVFCRESQIKDEFMQIWDIIEAFYAAAGFTDLKVRISLHDPENFDAYLGTKESWEGMENALRELVKERGITDAVEALGEAAFYGPKLDFMTKDAIGREWQVATIQIDKNQPEGFDLNCINEEGEKERIVMIHCAIMGSIERFVSNLIEHHAGAFPLWISPVQVQLIAVGGGHVDFCHNLAQEMRAEGLRVEVDDAAESVGKKIRNATKMKIPYVLVVGDNEMESGNLAIRKRGEQDAHDMSKEEFIAHASKLNSERSPEL